MEAIDLIVQFPALAGLIVALWWNKTLQDRLDRMNDRQNNIMDALLKKTDLAE